MGKLMRLVYIIFIIAFTVAAYQNFSEGDMVWGIIDSFIVLADTFLVVFGGRDQ